MTLPITNVPLAVDELTPVTVGGVAWMTRALLAPS
jgi:hypothetical protein